MSAIKVGDNFDPSVDQGPQNSKMQFDKILGYIESGKQEGATVHLGGEVEKVGEGGGYYIKPTIFTNATPNMKVSTNQIIFAQYTYLRFQIMREEIFGPVVAIGKFKTEEEVLELANDTTYGLAAAVHTKDYERAIRITNGLKAGTTWVNMYNFVHWSIPFGGYKESGSKCIVVGSDELSLTKHSWKRMRRRSTQQLYRSQSRLHEYGCAGSLGCDCVFIHGGIEEHAGRTNGIDAVFLLSASSLCSQFKLVVKWSDHVQLSR